MPNKILTAREVRQSIWEALGGQGEAPPEPTCKDPSTGPWEVQVFGKPCSESWEISVIRKNYEHGHYSWGWFDANKLLISHNGGPCRWPLIRPVWDRMIQAAHDTCNELNAAEGR
jgi:hypothetical protein